MNFPNRLELLLWAVLAFPKACKEKKNRFSDGEDEISTGLRREPQCSLWASQASACRKSLSGPGDNTQACSPGALRCTRSLSLFGLWEGLKFQVSDIKNANHRNSFLLITVRTACLAPGPNPVCCMFLCRLQAKSGFHICKWLKKTQKNKEE